MLKQLDERWYQGEYLNITDEGPVSPGSVTRKFALRSRQSGSLLGYVKWFVYWRQYCFFPSGFAVFDKTCLREIAEFCEHATNERRAARSRT